jgi:hypothetical protein
MIDSYQALLEQLDDWHAKNVDANEIAWLQTARQLDRTIAAGARMAELLTDIARSADPQQRDEIGSRLNAWHHATNTR